MSSGQELTPRELFFAAPSIKAHASNAKKPAVSPLKSNSPASRPVEIAKSTPPASPQVPKPAQQIPGGAQVIPAAYVNSSVPPLGLRYSLLLSRDNGPYQEADAAMTFRSGDRLKITVEANDDAFLYVIARGSSGLWKPLFPTQEVDNGNNRIQPFRRYEVPYGGRFYFDDQAGTENLFIVLSRQPEPNFEELIYTVNDAKAPSAAPAPAAAPTTAPASKPAKTLQVAALIRPMDDALIGKVRSELIARDLIFEKVDDSKATSSSPSDRQEKAVYVLNRKATPEAKLVVDLKLEHR